jgi:2-oxoglutarate dehydrogenase E2 component (dihydrolipoamide succinyltransferase)
VTSIQMPQLGETIVEGTILRWLKHEGEAVARDEALFEISTDKVDTEVPSPVAGTVTRLLVAEGDTVAVGTAVMEIDDGAAGATEPAAPAAAEAPAPAAVPAAPVPPPAEPAPVAQPAASVAPVASLPDRGPRSQIVSPIVRRLAKENGIDLATLAGSGTGGRITKRDVLAAIASGGPPGAAMPSVGGPTGLAGPARVAPPAPAAPGAGEELVQVTHIRRAIAQHMLASLQTSARAWTMVEVNVEHLVRLRDAARSAFEQKYGAKLTYLPFVVRATCDALLTYPVVNAELRGDDLAMRRFVHMGIAVSYDQGLIVPVVRNADSLNVPGIARAIADLAGRARSHELKPDEVQGSTFTITNPGPYGSIASVPIINQPNAAILSFDAIQKRPVVIDDAIAIRHMVNLSMTWDHRSIDGELATRFLARIKENLETWDFSSELGL